MPKEEITKRLIEISNMVSQARIDLREMASEIPTDCVEEYREVVQILCSANGWINLLDILYSSQ